MWYLVLDDIVYAHLLSFFDSALFFLSIFLKSDISPQRSDLEWGKNETDEWDPIRCKCHSIIEFLTPVLVYKKSECQWNCVSCLGVCMYLTICPCIFHETTLPVYSTLLNMQEREEMTVPSSSSSRHIATAAAAIVQTQSLPLNVSSQNYSIFVMSFTPNFSVQFYSVLSKSFYMNRNDNYPARGFQIIKPLGSTFWKPWLSQ